MDKKKIAIFFPGIGSHCDKPLLYYARKLAVEAGFEDYRNVTYTCSVKKIRGDKDMMKKAFDELYGQTEEALKDIDWDEYDDILFVSKSIGTAIAIFYAKKHGIENVRHVLYTPLAETFEAAEGMDKIHAIAFIGTGDPWSDVLEVASSAEDYKVPITIYEGVNHSLEGDDTMANLELLSEVMEKTGKFMASRM